MRVGVLVLAALAAIVLGGCGGSSKSSSNSTPTGTPTAAAGGSGGAGAGGKTLALAADKSKLAFDKTTLSAPAGKVTIVMTNPSSIPHDIAIQGNGAHAVGKVVSSGGKSIASADLKPGKYTFYCSVDGHRQAGMQGALTVK